MQEVWYVNFADNIDLLDPNAVLNEAWPGIVVEDPYAVLLDVKVFPKQIGFKIGHPDTVQEAISLGFNVTQRTLEPISATIVALISWKLVAAILIVGIVVVAYFGYSLLTRTYNVRDPTTGDTVTVEGWSAYMAYLISNYPEAADYLNDLSLTAWWESIGGMLKWLVILVGLGIGGYLLLKYTQVI